MPSLTQIGVAFMVGAIAMLIITHTIVWHKDEKEYVRRYYEMKANGLRPGGDIVWAWLRSVVRKTCMIFFVVGLFVFLIGNV